MSGGGGVLAFSALFNGDKDAPTHFNRTIGAAYRPEPRPLRDAVSERVRPDPPGIPELPRAVGSTEENGRHDG